MCITNLLVFVLDRRARVAQSVQKLGYGMDNRGSVPARGNDGSFSLQHCVQTGSGAHPSSYPMGTGSSFPGIRRPGRKADHSPPSSAKIKNAWCCTTFPPSFQGVVVN
jgi:hypothetical protein